MSQLGNLCNFFLILSKAGEKQKQKNCRFTATPSNTAITQPSTQRNVGGLPRFFSRDLRSHQVISCRQEEEDRCHSGQLGGEIFEGWWPKILKKCDTFCGTDLSESTKSLGQTDGWHW